MAHHSTQDAVEDLERSGQLIRVVQEVDPHLELAELQRRLYACKAPAVLFERVKGTPFPVLANLYGTVDRARFLFRHTLSVVEALVQAKGDPLSILHKPGLLPKLPFAGLNALPRKKSTGPVFQGHTTLAQLPQIISWPQDGGAFITLPQVLSADPLNPSIFKSNMGMYRVQISGNDYVPNQECGMHYQIHRGIGVHHLRAIEKGEPLKVTIAVGGPPAHAFASVMPLPENMPEVAFAGLLAGTPFRYTNQNGWIIPLDADFCILGTISQEQKEEGPFGDHLGYYSLRHLFPLMKVNAVHHRRNAIWNFTSVGRPPQEDTTFGDLIHEITGDAVCLVLPGVKQIHAVDAAGVHPLLLAIGSERYIPYQQREPMEILTQANALLGFGQVSLSKYLFIVAAEDDQTLNARHVEVYIRHVLQRIDLKRDLHFQTSTTIDTLDYSGTAVNHGSKLVIAAAGTVRRALGDEQDLKSLSLPDGFSNPRMVIPGVMVLEGSPWRSYSDAEQQMQRLSEAFSEWEYREAWPWVSVVNSSAQARALHDWLWVTFTRSNPSHDIYGVHSAVQNKHWQCEAPLIVDARIKAHHAPALEQDPAVVRKADSWFTEGAPFAKFG